MFYFYERIRNVAEKWYKIIENKDISILMIELHILKQKLKMKTYVKKTKIIAFNITISLLFFSRNNFFQMMIFNNS